MNNTPLRYNISDWHQLSDVKSNNSRDLFITVSDFIHDERLSGLRIEVKHLSFGILFSCIVNAHGTLISEVSADTVYELSPKQILSQLELFGFFVTFNPMQHLPKNQIEFLKTIQALHFDKIRILNVWHNANGIKQFKWYVVAFNIKENPDWINNGYSPSEKEFKHSLEKGSAMNVSAVSKEKHWNWSWLDFVANIQDILDENQS